VAIYNPDLGPEHTAARALAEIIAKGLDQE
jgi:hypothetical protein